MSQQGSDPHSFAGEKKPRNIHELQNNEYTVEPLLRSKEEEDSLSTKLLDKVLEKKAKTPEDKKTSAREALREEGKESTVNDGNLLLSSLKRLFQNKEEK